MTLNLQCTIQIKTTLVGVLVLVFDLNGGSEVWDSPPEMKYHHAGHINARFGVYWACARAYAISGRWVRRRAIVTGVQER